MEKWLTYAKQNAWLLLILTGAALLRFYHADFQSFWLDETLTIMETDPTKTFRQTYDTVLSW